MKLQVKVVNLFLETRGYHFTTWQNHFNDHFWAKWYIVEGGVKRLVIMEVTDITEQSIYHFTTFIEKKVFFGRNKIVKAMLSQRNTYRFTV